MLSLSLLRSHYHEPGLFLFWILVLDSQVDIASSLVYILQPYWSSYRTDPVRSLFHLKQNKTKPKAYFKRQSRSSMNWLSIPFLTLCLSSFYFPSFTYVLTKRKCCIFPIHPTSPLLSAFASAASSNGGFPLLTFCKFKPHPCLKRAPAQTLFLIL